MAAPAVKWHRAPVQPQALRLQAVRLAKVLAAVLAAGLLIALGGSFAWFVHEARATPPPLTAAPAADGVVVLTGGAGRIEAGVRLLLAGRARLMLISGVQPGVELAELVPPSLGLNRTAMAKAAPRIALGHTATDTIGNARETAAWVRMNDLHSILVVTASYHLRRAMREIGTALPDVALRGWAVSPPVMSRPLGLHGWALLGREYAKWLVVSMGLTGGAHLREMG